ncbi:MAG: hypothetical protein LBC51_04340, partial [Treponema sp.]|nr:hypothetical protein [Treponema sp.]
MNGFMQSITSPGVYSSKSTLWRSGLWNGDGSSRHMVGKGEICQNGGMKEQFDIERFYEGVLGIPAIWKVTKVEKDQDAKEIRLTIEYGQDYYRCPECGKEGKLHD